VFEIWVIYLHAVVLLFRGGIWLAGIKVGYFRELQAGSISLEDPRRVWKAAEKGAKPNDLRVDYV
jgi:hypothetical protein